MSGATQAGAVSCLIAAPIVPVSGCEPLNSFTFARATCISQVAEREAQPGGMP